MGNERQSMNRLVHKSFFEPSYPLIIFSDCSVRCSPSCSFIHPPSRISLFCFTTITTFFITRETDPSQFSVFCCTGCTCMGRRNVVVQRERRDYTTRNVQLDDIPVPRLGEVERSEDAALAQHVGWCTYTITDRQFAAITMLSSGFLACFPSVHNVSRFAISTADALLSPKKVWMRRIIITSPRS